MIGGSLFHTVILDFDLDALDEKFNEPQGKLLGLSFVVLGLLYHGLNDIIRDDLVILHDDIIEFMNAVVKVTLVLDNKVFFSFLRAWR